MTTFADRINAFNRQLDYRGSLPDGISIMNPFRDNDSILPISSVFYNKYYHDNIPRHLILGINPGRFGAGVTGIPFTDPKRLIEKCGLEFQGELKHEPSSVFVYEMIDAYGGAEAFYRRFYINSVCPLGFTATGPKGKEVNFNYYDRADVTGSVYNFIIDNIQKQIAIGVKTDVCFCFGTGKNEAFLRKLNDRMGFFGKIIALEHPRFIMQYKSRSKQLYIDKYLSAFAEIADESGV
ncbi:MAG: uracil-DNA glycosylase family protein [bacterium]